eukprot:gene9176-1264_t
MSNSQSSEYQVSIKCTELKPGDVFIHNSTYIIVNDFKFSKKGGETKMIIEGTSLFTGEKIQKKLGIQKNITLFQRAKLDSKKLFQNDFNIACQHLKVGDIIIGQKNELIRITKLSLLTTKGKYGHTKVNSVGIEISTGLQVNQMFNQYHSVYLLNPQFRECELLSIENDHYTIFDDNEQNEENKFKNIQKIFTNDLMKSKLEIEYKNYLEHQYNFESVLLRIFDYKDDIYIGSFEFKQIEIMKIMRKDFDINFGFGKL